MKRQILQRLAFAFAAAALLAAAAPAQAADLGGLRPHARPHHGRMVWRDANWRDRCAYEGYYCLYAEYGFVYHYPWDDRPIAQEFYARRHWRR